MSASGIVLIASPTRGGGRDARLAVEVSEAENVTREDQVRVLDLRIRLPDLRPEPRLPEEAAGNVPERVALLDDIGGRMTLAEFSGDDAAREREQRGSGNCKKPIKHGGYPPDFPGQVGRL